jgi:hypothetical protein
VRAVLEQHRKDISEEADGFDRKPSKLELQK